MNWLRRWFGPKVVVTIDRDSVSMGDDVDEHVKTWSFPENTSLMEMVGVVLRSGYLPLIQGEKATWVLQGEGKMLAVVAQEWRGPEFLVDPTLNLRELGGKLAFTFRYLLQRDPSLVLERLRGGYDFAEVATDFVALEKFIDQKGIGTDATVKALFARAIRAVQKDFDAGGSSAFSDFVVEENPALYDARCVTDPSLNAIWNYVEEYFDARWHGFKDFNGIPWPEADRLLAEILGWLDRQDGGELDERIMGYRYPKT